MSLDKLTKEIIRLINSYHREEVYIYEKYQLLHGVKYRKNMSEKNCSRIRERYRTNSFEAAYELKTYYIENGKYKVFVQHKKYSQ